MRDRPGLVWEFPVKRRPPLAGFRHSYIDGLLSRVGIVKRKKRMHLPKDTSDGILAVERMVEEKEAGIATGIANRCDDRSVIGGKLACIDAGYRAALLSPDRVRLLQFTGPWHST
jgi:hypothetical protein